MRRLPVLAVLVLAALIAASTWLAIVAQSDPEPLPTAEHLPRDDEQQQDQSQSQPAQPDDQAEPDTTAQQEQSDQEAGSEEDQPDQQAEEDDGRSTDEDANEPVESEQAEEPVIISDVDLPEQRLIAAIDIDRRQPEEPARREFEYEVELGDTLSRIASIHDVDLFQLAQANGIAPNSIIQVEDVLHIPARHSYIPLEAPPGPEDYAGGGLIWGTIRDAQLGVVHSAVVYFIDHRAGLPGAPDLIIGCVNNRPVVELAVNAQGSDTLSGKVRLYWRVDRGPLQTSLWTIDEGVLSAPRPAQFIDSLRGALDLRLYPAAPHDPHRFYWYPSPGQMVETPVQPNIENCGR